MVDIPPAKLLGQSGQSFGGLVHEFARLDAMLAFRGPLLLFSVPPEDEEAGEDEGQGEGEPGAINELCGGRG